MTTQTLLRQTAYELIRSELLVRGPLAFGGRLVEQELATRLSMSRTPVRDALRQLAAIGLVERAPGGGYLPRRLRLRDLREEYELRSVLEGRAAFLAASTRSIGREDRDALLAADAPDGSGFHLAIAEASGNRVLARSIDAISTRSFMHRLGSIVSPDDRRRLRAGHEAVLAAVLAGAAESAEQRMREHLALACELSVAALQGDGASG